MAKVVNLRRAKKQKAREDARAERDAATKAARGADSADGKAAKARALQEVTRLEGHRLDREKDD